MSIKTQYDEKEGTITHIYPEIFNRDDIEDALIREREILKSINKPAYVVVDVTAVKDTDYFDRAVSKPADNAGTSREDNFAGLMILVNKEFFDYMQNAVSKFAGSKNDKEDNTKTRIVIESEDEIARIIRLDSRDKQLREKNKLDNYQDNNQNYSQHNNNG